MTQQKWLRSVEKIMNCNATTTNELRDSVENASLSRTRTHAPRGAATRSPRRARARRIRASRLAHRRDRIDIRARTDVNVSSRVASTAKWSSNVVRALFRVVWRVRACERRAK